WWAPFSCQILAQGDAATCRRIPLCARVSLARAPAPPVASGTLPSSPYARGDVRLVESSRDCPRRDGSANRRAAVAARARGGTPRNLDVGHGGGEDGLGRASRGVARAGARRLRRHLRGLGGSPASRRPR